MVNQNANVILDIFKIFQDFVTPARKDSTRVLSEIMTALLVLPTQRRLEEAKLILIVSVILVLLPAKAWNALHVRLEHSRN